MKITDDYHAEDLEDLDELIQQAEGYLEGYYPPTGDIDAGEWMSIHRLLQYLRAADISLERRHTAALLNQMGYIRMIVGGVSTYLVLPSAPQLRPSA